MNKTINKNRLIYLISSIGGRFYILLTIPLLTKYLSKDDFGFYMILVQLVVLVQASLLILFSNGLLKFLIDTKEEERKAFMGTIFISFLLFSIFTISSLYFSRDFIFSIFFPNVTQSLNPTLLFTLLWLFALSMRSFFLTFVELLEKAKYVLVHIVVYGIVLVILLTYQLVYNNGGISDAMQSFFIAEVFALWILVLPVLENLSLKFKLEYLKVFMKFSLPLIGGSLAFIAFMNIDRIVLAQYVSLEEMGVYGIGFMFGSLAGMIVTANMSAYLPRVKKVMASGDEAEVKRLTTHYMKEIQHLMLIVVFAIAIVNDLIIYIFANKYSGSLSAMIMVGVAIGHLARSNYIFFEQILFLKDRVKSIFFIKLLVLVIGLVLGFFIISSLGLTGAALLWMMTFFIVNIIVYQFIKQYNLLEINIKRTIMVFILVSILLYSEYYFQDSIGLSFEYISLKLIESFIATILIIKYYKLYISRGIING